MSNIDMICIIDVNDSPSPTHYHCDAPPPPPLKYSKNYTSSDIITSKTISTTINSTTNER